MDVIFVACVAGAAVLAVVGIAVAASGPVASPPPRQFALDEHSCPECDFRGYHCPDHHGCRVRHEEVR